MGLTGTAPRAHKIKRPLRRATWRRHADGWRVCVYAYDMPKPGEPVRVRKRRSSSVVLKIKEVLEHPPKGGVRWICTVHGRAEWDLQTS